MRHRPKPVRSGPNWVCATCGERVGEYRRGQSAYWRHVTRGPEIAYGRALREGA